MRLAGGQCESHHSKQSDQPTQASVGIFSIMSFASPQDEANHYRKRCKELESALLETQSALDEFQQSSKDLEQELEKELSIMEKHNKDMLKKNEALRNEVETWKVGLRVTLMQLLTMLRLNIRTLPKSQTQICPKSSEKWII